MSKAKKSITPKEIKVKWNGEVFYTRVTPERFKVYKAYKHHILVHRPGSNETFFLDSTYMEIL